MSVDKLDKYFLLIFKCSLLVSEILILHVSVWPTWFTCFYIWDSYNFVEVNQELWPLEWTAGLYHFVLGGLRHLLRLSMGTDFILI